MSTSNNVQYYTCREQLLKVYDESARQYGLKAEDAESHSKWKSEVRALLADITGISRMRKCELLPKVLERKQMDGYMREKVVIQVEEGVWMPFYILIPDDIKEGEKRPCIIAAHGHGSCGKYAVAGRTDIPVVKRVIESSNVDYGLQLVKKGFIVFCPDARGSGERREWMNQGEEESKMMESSCFQLNNAAISLGRSLTGMWTWDLSRLIDYIETFEICDPDRIGCCGFSGGGLQSIWLAAMDDRIKCAIVSGYFHGYRDSLLKTNFCGCNFVPHLWEYVDMGDIGALIAPRPLLIESGANDPLNGERGLTDVKEQLEITKTAYKLYGEESKLYHHVFEGGHRWDGEKAYEFFAKWL